MDDEISLDVIKATQTSLGKYIKRPPLSDKLLKKPPFRFLHDIITSVLKSTGFFNGLFEDEELISEKVKDRDSKILFLQKVIFVVVTTTGKSLNVKPSKIVAGQEPEKTNELLQCLAYALDNKLSSDEAVRLYKESNKSSKSSDHKSKEAVKSLKKTADTKKLTSKSSEKLTKNEKPNNVSVKNRQKQSNLIKKESPPKKISNSSKEIRNKNIINDKQENKTEIPNNIVYDNDQTEPVQGSKASVVIETKIESDQIGKGIIDQSLTESNSTGAENDIEDTKISDHLDHSKQSKEENEHQETNNQALVDNDISQPAGIASANNINKEDTVIKSSEDSIHVQNQQKSPAENNVAPLESNNENLISLAKQNNEQPLQVKPTESVNKMRPQSVRPSSSRPSAPRIKDKNESLISSTDNLVVAKVNIIAENMREEEDDNSIVIVEATEPDTQLKDQEDLLSSNQHGHLVQQILDAQKEFSEVSGKTNIEWQFGVQKSRDVINQEIEQLRFNVQALSRVANPLGKLLDHVQEDVEVMRQELQQWTIAYEEASKQLSKQKASNEESLLPLHTKINQLQQDITEKRDKINDLKIIINKNSLRIEKLLASGNMQY